VGVLKIALGSVLLTWAMPVCADPLDRWADHISEAARRFEIPESWVRRVMRAESGGRTMMNGRPIVSRAGAMGLMQLMPGTWREMRAALRLGDDPHHPRDNILAGTAYLRKMYDRFGYPGLFGAYNAGPGLYGEHLASGRRLPMETIRYVAAVAPGRRSVSGKEKEAAPIPALFAIRPIGPPAELSEGAAASMMRGDSLFVRLSSASR
jgi:soluble lytic murein transglycosylase-like protein